MIFDGRPSRRVALAGLGTAMFVHPGSAADSPVAIGPLANNKLALAFEKAPAGLPDVRVIGPEGERDIGDVIRGRTVLMPLWAEWCMPCLIELSDFGRLQEVYGNDKFAIIPVLTATRRKFTPKDLGEVLRVVNAAQFTPLMESNFGDRLARTMAQQGRDFALPCNVLIAPDGNVVGREISLQTIDNADDPASPKDNRDRLNQALSGKTQSLWGTASGDEFATCLSGGFVKYQ